MKFEPSTDAPLVTRKFVHACESMFNNMINIANNNEFNFLIVDIFFLYKDKKNYFSFVNSF